MFNSSIRRATALSVLALLSPTFSQAAVSGFKTYISPGVGNWFIWLLSLWA